MGINAFQRYTLYQNFPTNNIKQTIRKKIIRNSKKTTKTLYTSVIRYANFLKEAGNLLSILI